NERRQCFRVQHGESCGIRARHGEKGISLVRGAVVEIGAEVASTRREQWRDDEQIARGFTKEAREPVEVRSRVDQPPGALRRRVVHGLMSAKELGEVGSLREVARLDEKG